MALASGDAPKRVALVLHPTRVRAHELAKTARSWWEDRGYEVIEDATVGGPDPGLVEQEVDLFISLGGDGTMLRTVQLAARHGIAVLGVNLGALGYLTQVEPATIATAFERIVQGDYLIEERGTLDVTLRSAEGESHFVGLNDAVLEKDSQGHTIHLQLHIDGRPFLSYVADGFLVSTPSGSTAYNLSLRGPIVSPLLEALVLTPISPHMLFDRSLVLACSETVDLEMLGERSGMLIVDGLSSVAVRPGDVVAVRAGAHPARVVTFGARDFYGVLRSKFGLADR